MSAHPIVFAGELGQVGARPRRRGSRNDANQERIVIAGFDLEPGPPQQLRQRFEREVEEVLDPEELRRWHAPRAGEVRHLDQQAAAGSEQAMQRRQQLDRIFQMFDDVEQGDDIEQALEVDTFDVIANDRQPVFALRVVRVESVELDPLDVCARLPAQRQEMPQAATNFQHLLVSQWQPASFGEVAEGDRGFLGAGVRQPFGEAAVGTQELRVHPAPVELVQRLAIEPRAGVDEAAAAADHVVHLLAPARPCLERRSIVGAAEVARDTGVRGHGRVRLGAR